MNYKGQLYGKVGATYIPLDETTEDVDRLRAERDELRAAAERLLKERQSGLASLDAWVQLRAALSRTEGGEK